ncbi:MAG: hypothetical protein PHY80_02515 [Rickettsiales bacterium]|nr:hypothetical protein [Rickettsiales bacterium]
MIKIGRNVFLGCFNAENVANGMRNTFNIKMNINNTWASVI